MKLSIAVAMLLAIAGLWYYNQKISAANQQAALAAQNHKPFRPVGSEPSRFRPATVATAFASTTPSQAAASKPTQFTCDGRTHCSHMRSCEEAKFFIQHCPNTQMDGDNDGIPCESQWC